jgi:hypothetical protein
LPENPLYCPVNATITGLQIWKLPPADRQAHTPPDLLDRKASIDEAHSAVMDVSYRTRIVA